MQELFKKAAMISQKPVARSSLLSLFVAAVVTVMSSYQTITYVCIYLINIQQKTCIPQPVSTPNFSRKVTEICKLTLKSGAANSTARTQPANVSAPNEYTQDQDELEVKTSSRSTGRPLYSNFSLSPQFPHSSAHSVIYSLHPSIYLSSLWKGMQVKLFSTAPWRRTGMLE